MSRRAKVDFNNRVEGTRKSSRQAGNPASPATTPAITKSEKQKPAGSRAKAVKTAADNEEEKRTNQQESGSPLNLLDSGDFDEIAKTPTYASGDEGAFAPTEPRKKKAVRINETDAGEYIEGFDDVDGACNSLHGRMFVSGRICSRSFRASAHSGIDACTPVDQESDNESDVDSVEPEPVPIVKRGRGRPPGQGKKAAPKTPKAVKLVSLPFPTESPRPMHKADFLCIYGNIYKPLKLGLFDTWAFGRIAILDAMNVAPHDRKDVSLAYKFADAKANEYPTALDDVEEFEGLLKELRLNLNDLAKSATKTKSMVKPKQPVTVMIAQVSIYK